MHNYVIGQDDIHSLKYLASLYSSSMDSEMPIKIMTNLSSSEWTSLGTSGCLFTGSISLLEIRILEI